MSDKNYFTKDTESHIIAFQREQDVSFRKDIFVKNIKPAFDKLVENIINVYRFHSIGDTPMMHNDCVSMLFENLHKFDGTKGHKAFSYFNVIAKNWFIQKSKIYKRRVRTDIHFDQDIQKDLEAERFVEAPREDEIVYEQYKETLLDEIRSWEGKFLKDNEKAVLSAVLHLMENPEQPWAYNKKSIYLYLREMTNMNTKQVVSHLQKFRKKYRNFKKRYNG